MSLMVVELLGHLFCLESIFCHNLLWMCSFSTIFWECIHSNSYPFWKRFQTDWFMICLSLNFCLCSMILLFIPNTDSVLSLSVFASGACHLRLSNSQPKFVFDPPDLPFIFCFLSFCLYLYLCSVFIGLASCSFCHISWRLGSLISIVSFF